MVKKGKEQNTYKPPHAGDEPNGAPLALPQASAVSYSTMSSSLTDDEKLSVENVTVDVVATSVDHRKVIRKLDLRLIPCVCLFYLLCFL